MLVKHGTFGRYLAGGYLVFARDQVMMAAALPDPSGVPSAPRPVVNGQEALAVLELALDVDRASGLPPARDASGRWSRWANDAPCER